MTGKRIDIQELIEKVRNGDDKAQIKLYRYYKKTLEKFLKRKYPKNYEFEDDVSEIALKIFEKLSSYDTSKSQFNTWVINIANNYMIDKSRKKKLIYVYESNYGGFSDDDNINIDNELLNIQDSSRPDVSCENTDILSHYSCTVDSRIFSMVNMKSQGYDYNEIGNEFNITSVQVSNKISYFQSKMKQRGE